MASPIYGYTAALANQKPKGIAKVYVKIAADMGYSSLGEIRNGEAHVRSSQAQDTYMRSYPFAAVAEYKFEMLQCSVTELELLDRLIAGDVYFLFLAVDGSYYVHDAANTLLGLKYRVVCDGKIDTNRFIEISAKVGLLASELDTVLPSVNPTVGAPGTGDTFWSIANSGSDVGNAGLPAHILPAGVATLEVCALSESSYDDVGEVTNSSLTFETFGEESDRLRYRQVGVEIKGSFDLMQSANADLANFDLIPANGMNVKITHFDSLLWTLANKVGVQFDYKNVGNFEGHKFVNLAFDGRILVSDFDGIVS